VTILHIHTQTNWHSYATSALTILHLAHTPFRVGRSRLTQDSMATIMLTSQQGSGLQHFLFVCAHHHTYIAFIIDSIAHSPNGLGKNNPTSRQ